MHVVHILTRYMYKVVSVVYCVRILRFGREEWAVQRRTTTLLGEGPMGKPMANPQDLLYSYTTHKYRCGRVGKSWI